MIEHLGKDSLRVAIASCLAAVTLAACSSGGSASMPDGGKEPGKATSALAKLSGEQMCKLVSDATIEQAFGGKVESTEGTERGRAPQMQSPYFLTRHCEYDVDGILGLSTDLTTKWGDRESDEDVLQDVFTGVTQEGKPGEYERVQGLGVLAGFGTDATLAQADVAGRELGVVLRVGDERLLLTVATLGRAKVTQLRPLAEELLKNLDAGAR